MRAFSRSVMKFSVVVTAFGGMSSGWAFGSDTPGGAENVLNSPSTSRCFGSWPFG